MFLFRTLKMDSFHMILRDIVKTAIVQFFFCKFYNRKPCIVNLSLPEKSFQRKQYFQLSELYFHIICYTFYTLLA